VRATAHEFVFRLVALIEADGRLSTSDVRRTLTRGFRDSCDVLFEHLCRCRGLHQLGWATRKTFLWRPLLMWWQ